MDEPTNHLDLDSKEVLEDAIMDYDGTVLVISHDRYFLNKISSKILEMTPYGLNEYLGDYDYYLEKKSLESSSEPDPVELINRTQSKALKKKDREAEKLERQEKKKIKNLEQSISELESVISSLEAKLCEPDVYSDHALSLDINKELQEQKALLEQSYEDWMILTES
jgi:ATP-binding cassette, subfamily F, member 3